MRLLAPVQRPPSVRDFYAFEQHVKNARAVTGRGEVPPEWYELPAFYFSNPAAIYGPDDEIPYPEGTEKLDYELECAVVIGADGAIGGFTVMNDWSARDLQRKEMAIGLGPAKGKDFATSLGPVLVTPDELGDLRLEMVARVNGEERSRGQPRRHALVVGRGRRARRAQHRASARRRDRLGHRRAPAASSSTATSAGCSQATRSSSRSKGSEPKNRIR